MKKAVIVFSVIVLLLVASIIALRVSTKTYSCPSESMSPSIPAGSKVWVDRAAYKHSSPARFDIVAFHPPDSPEHEYVFRIIGLAGETVGLTNKVVLINDKPIDLPHGLKYVSLPSRINRITLEADQYFVLGDNSYNARDSRFFGAIDETAIIGKVMVIRLISEPATQGDEG